MTEMYNKLFEQFPIHWQATRVNLFHKKLPKENRMLFNMMHGTATLDKFAVEV